MYKKIKKGWSKHFDFMLVDLVCITAAFIISYFLRYRTLTFTQEEFYQQFLLVVMGLHILLVFFFEPYHGILRRGKLQEIEKILGYNTILLLGIFLYLFMIKRTGEMSRVLMVGFWFLCVVFMYGARILLKSLLLKRFNNPRHFERLMIVTEWKDAKAIIQQIKDNNYGKIRIKGIVVTDVNLVGQFIEQIPVVANQDTLLEYTRTQVVDRVLMNVHGDWAKETINQLVTMGVTVHINVENLSCNFPNCTVECINGTNVITTSINVATDRQLFLKRAVDIVGSIVGMVICGISFIFVAPVIYIQSPGPIFFRQTRVGKNGRKFQIYKYRTMYLNAEERKLELMAQNEMSGLMFKMKEDPRIFPAGKILRAASIDELPQFWNVLKGDMSLVGTRPPTVDEYEKYDLKDKSRLATQAGMTGMWQVSGRSDISDFKEVVKLDNEYIRNWTPSLDIKILLKTVLVVLKRDGSR